MQVPQYKASGLHALVSHTRRSYTQGKISRWISIWWCFVFLIWFRKIFQEVSDKPPEPFELPLRENDPFWQHASILGWGHLCSSNKGYFGEITSLSFLKLTLNLQQKKLGWNVKCWTRFLDVKILGNWDFAQPWLAKIAVTYSFFFAFFLIFLMFNKSYLATLTQGPKVELSHKSTLL